MVALQNLLFSMLPFLLNLWKSHYRTLPTLVRMVPSSTRKKALHVIFNQNRNPTQWSIFWMGLPKREICTLGKVSTLLLLSLPLFGLNINILRHSTQVVWNTNLPVLVRTTTFHLLVVHMPCTIKYKNPMTHMNRAWCFPMWNEDIGDHQI